MIKDNEESRTGIERRQFSYTAYIPERRSGKDRRNGFERISAIYRIRKYDRRSKQSIATVPAKRAKEAVSQMQKAQEMASAMVYEAPTKSGS